MGGNTENYLPHSGYFHNAGAPGIITTRDLSTRGTVHHTCTLNWVPLQTSVIRSALLHQIRFAAPGPPVWELLSSLRSMQTVECRSPRSSGKGCCLSTVYQRWPPSLLLQPSQSQVRIMWWTRMDLKQKPPFPLALINRTEKSFRKERRNHTD